MQQQTDRGTLIEWFRYQRAVHDDKPVWWVARKAYRCWRRQR